ncbi:MAG: hypothetical protein AAFV46_00170 [Cyanobacteria bacterium J06635_11]
MAKNTRARAVKLDEQTLTDGSASYRLYTAGANQLTLLLQHSEGSNATLLSVTVFVTIINDSSAAAAVNSVFGANASFPLGEESVGDAASGVTPVTVTQRRYDFGADSLDSILPVITLPISTGEFSVSLEFEETADSDGTIKGVLLRDDV